MRGGSVLQTHGQPTCGPHLASIHPRSRLSSGVPWSPPDPLWHQPPLRPSPHASPLPEQRFPPFPSLPPSAMDSRTLASKPSTGIFLPIPVSQLLMKINFNLQPQLSSDSP